MMSTSRTTAQPAPPPTPQEIHRKLSVHSVSPGPRLRQKAPAALPTTVTGAPVSGTESDSDSLLTPDVPSQIIQAQPLSSIAERCSDSGEDTEDEVHNSSKVNQSANVQKQQKVQLPSAEECVIKAGYLWKKGERRKTWKKRWFVLRPLHIAYYKSSAEYELLRLLELSDIHSCTAVNLKRHEHTFGLISPVRTFYLEAENDAEVQSWIEVIGEAKEALMAVATRDEGEPIGDLVGQQQTAPINTQQPRSTSKGSHGPLIPSSPGLQGPGPSSSSYGHNIITSSDSEDGTVILQQNLQQNQQTQYYSHSPSQPFFNPISPQKGPAHTAHGVQGHKDPSKVILSGYLMKRGSKRRNWRKRWFVLTGEKLVYSGSHMDTKPHRQFPFNDILDALEYELPSQHQHISTSLPHPSALSSPPDHDFVDASGSSHTFKIVTTKRTLLLCAPSEEDEIKWLGAIRALIMRRAEAGGVPGKTKAKHQSALETSPPLTPSQPQIQAFSQAHPKPASAAMAASTSGGGGSSGGLKVNFRRLSSHNITQTLSGGSEGRNS